MKGKHGFGRVPVSTKGTEREIQAFSERPSPDERERTWNPYGRRNVMAQLEDISYDDWNPNAMGFIVRSRP